MHLYFIIPWPLETKRIQGDILPVGVYTAYGGIVIPQKLQENYILSCSSQIWQYLSGFGKARYYFLVISIPSVSKTQIKKILRLRIIFKCQNNLKNPAHTSWSKAKLFLEWRKCTKCCALHLCYSNTCCSHGPTNTSPQLTK